MNTAKHPTLFRPITGPRLFGCPPGQDFPAAIVDGLTPRLAGLPPEAAARVTIYVNTKRMKRRIVGLLHRARGGFLPRVRLVQEIADDPAAGLLPPPVSDLRRRLELRQLVARLVSADGSIAPQAAVPDLADSLAGLLDEMVDEGIDPQDVAGLDVGDVSGHWQKTLQFLDIIARYRDLDASQHFSAAARFREAAETLTSAWRDDPPTDPILIAGSTGSRGTTAMVMRAIARLPQGAVILPGFDFELPATVWAQLRDAGEDHPQFRFARLMGGLSATHDDVLAWHGDVSPRQADRNRLISLALRPAPVTHQWMAEGPNLTGIHAAVENMSLIEAASPRKEANAIALRLRQAAEAGQSAALVTRDKGLTRLVVAALDRWKIEPDASIGQALQNTPSGRLFRQVLVTIGDRVETAALLALLKHPLVSSGAGRGVHLTQTRAWEIYLRKAAIPSVKARHLRGWADTARAAPNANWIDWVGQACLSNKWPETASLETHCKLHVTRTMLFARGPDKDADNSELWAMESGIKLREFLGDLQSEARFGGKLSRTEYAQLFENLLSGQEARDPVQPHPNIMIWGTLEARVQGADLVILGGLNEGSWPELPSADPWLNRALRLEAGLLAPERRIGLAAHDFQQAVAAKEVVLTRALRDAEAETVPSRWLNRLINLLAGCGAEGQSALAQLCGNGAQYLRLADELERPKLPVKPEPRPAPAPPIAARPENLSVSDISKLIRDPYAIYARKILGLKPMAPLNAVPTAAHRGTAIHAIMERAMTAIDPASDLPARIEQLMAVARGVISSAAPWAETQILWLARLRKSAGPLLVKEADRRSKAQIIATEVKGSIALAETPIVITCKADRIDRRGSGELDIYDYKTGVLPTKATIEKFDKQLMIEVLVAQSGGFDGVPAAPVSEAKYLGISPKAKETDVPFQDIDLTEFQDELETFLLNFSQAHCGYVSRRDPDPNYGGDFDHLARFGEWDDPDEPVRVDVR